MKIEYFHASKYGNGAKVAEEFERRMAGRGVVVAVHHLREIKPTEIPPADLYLFSSPGRMGRPIGSMRRFLKQAALPLGARYALLPTEMAPRPDKKTGSPATVEERSRWQRVIPLMNEILQDRGFVPVAEGTILVDDVKGPLEEDWEQKVEAFANRIALLR